MPRETMRYYLLTGGTGLLGCYLLRDCQQAGLRFAVLARSSPLEPARQRVEGLMTRWEKLLGYALPRPVVLEGDICEPNLGLSPEQVQWVARNCRGVIHSAASLTFQTTRDNEPWRSNIEGTQHVLNLCRETGLQEMHHVSTAYVCGLRTGRTLETELDVGQAMGNDYETSKVRSEKMVREFGFRSLTVYRPAIIIGDSKTGYSTTFHGFYAPLKVALGIVSRSQPGTEHMPTMMDALALQGTEHKNFVPVDWVGAAMAHILRNPNLHGQTYHFAPNNRVTVREVAAAISQEIYAAAAKNPQQFFRSAAPASAELTALLQKTFREQLAVYQSYWRDDPEFDMTNTHRAVPHLPCPEITPEMLSRMCRYALEANFGWPRTRSEAPPFDVHQHLSALPHPAQPVQDAHSLGLQVNGQGGGQWEIRLSGGRVLDVREGIAPECSAIFYLNSHTFLQLTMQQYTVQHSLRTGQMLIEGNGLPVDRLVDALQQTVSGGNLSSNTI